MNGNQLVINVYLEVAAHTAKKRDKKTQKNLYRSKLYPAYLHPQVRFFLSISSSLLSRFCISYTCIFSPLPTMFTTYTLPNALRLVVSPVPTVGSITLLVLVKAGSRYEEKKINGIAHFLEHMFFKGAEIYKTPKDVALAVDRLGGMSNAFTDKEYVGYYIRVASEYVETAFEILSDMLLTPAFPVEEIEKERGVILEEMNMYQDSPAQQIFWDFERHMFGDQPLGRDEIGTKEFIETVTREDFMKYKKSLYTPDQTVISIAGNITPKHAKLLTEKYFGTMEGVAEKSYVPFVAPKENVVTNIRVKDTDQAHVMLGIQGLSMHEDDRIVQKVLSIMLGGNSSSRMFQHLREEKGLCYYVHSGGSSYHDAGTFYAKAGISIGRIEEALPALASEFRAMFAPETYTEEELQRAKSYFKGTLALSMEDTESVAHYMGKEWLLKGNITTFEELKEKIDGVSMEDLARVSEQYFQKSPLYLSIIGPYAGKEETFTRLVQ